MLKQSKLSLCSDANRCGGIDPAQATTTRRSDTWSLPGDRRDPEDRAPLLSPCGDLKKSVGSASAESIATMALPPVLARRRTGPYVLVAPFVFEVEFELPAVVDHREEVEGCGFR